MRGVFASGGGRGDDGARGRRRWSIDARTRGRAWRARLARRGGVMAAAGASAVGVSSARLASAARGGTEETKKKKTTKKDDTDTDDDDARRRRSNAWATSLAGAIAGASARVCVAPLDVIKIRLQVQLEAGAAGKYRGLTHAATTILREEGARAMWAGTVPALFLWVPYTAIQFTVLNAFKDAAEEWERARPGSTRGVPVSFIGGALAGSAATVATYPFDVIRTLLASQGHPKVYRGVLDAAAGVARERGVARGLYAGVSVTLAEIVPASAVQFGSYAALKTRFPDIFGENDFACGFAAGTIARLVIHPLDVVKKRFQVAGFSRNLAYGARVDAHAYRNFFAAVSTIAQKEGALGFYKGLAPSLIKSAPASAVTFSVFESVRCALAGGGDDGDAARRRRR